MSFFVFFFFGSLIFVLSEKCSKTLFEVFKKNFNVTDSCDNCVILNPRISRNTKNWAGFCIGDQLFLFKNWKCKEENRFLTKTDSLIAIVSNESCKITEENYDLDEQCLKKLNAEMCNVIWKSQDKKEKFNNRNNPTLLPLTVSDAKKFRLKNDFDTLKNRPFDSQTIFGKRSTWLTKISTAKTTLTETTSREDTSEETISTEEVSTKVTATKEISAKTKFTEKTSTEIRSKETSTATKSKITAQTESTKSLTFASTELTQDFSVNTALSTADLNNSFSSTTKPSAEDIGNCEPNEFFFRNHCYFIQFYRKSYYDSKQIMKVYSENKSKEIVSLDTINITRSCQNRHSKALGLAVETEEENNVVMMFLKTLFFYNNCTIFTSGARLKGENIWRGWNLKINQSVIDFKESDVQPDNAFYCIDACKNYWYLLRPAAVYSMDLHFYEICERPHNPKNILPELHKECLKLYRKSMCYNLEKHPNYCCEKDERGEIWFACPNETYRKIYSDHLQCSWTCNQTGFFFKDRPICKGSFMCNESYDGVRYIAPTTRYAVSDCPDQSLGHSTWYCSRNKTFVGKPDLSLCCKDTMLSCRDTDVFLNVWMGCPSNTVVKKTACPPGSYLKEALAEWYCQENGTFRGATPDYSNCNITKIKCSKKDRYGTQWETAPGATGEKACPPSFTGKCFWKCKESGIFDGPEPDCSRCMASWMIDIDNKIKNRSNYEEVMEIMKDYTKEEDLRIGYSHVLTLMSDCVALFKNQTPNGTFSIFDKFLKSYSIILKNIAGNPNIWSSFSETNREDFSNQILKTTQKAAFAKLESKNLSTESYNATLAESSADGFDFFVAYQFTVGLNFPLKKFLGKNWNLDIKEIKKSNTSVAAMGLVMNYKLSLLMFPQRKEAESLKINSPVITFKVASCRNGEMVIQPNVIVSISFKHINKTRLPATRVIKRRLHEGEEPSGVFNSTLCYYYRDSTWTTEGCSVTFASKERTNCTCNHLSTIGLLMSIHEYEPNINLEVVSTISSVITIISLILAILVFCYFDTVKNDRVFISQNLCFCLLIGHTMLITVMDKKFFNIPDNFCTVYAVALHYVFMAAFAWMLVEGCHLYRMLVLVFDSDIEYRWFYLIFGYGAPFAIVGSTELIGLMLKEQPYGQDELCWLRPPKYIWAFVGPVLVTTLINFCILVTAMKLAISSKRKTEKSNFGTLKLWIKGWITLSSLLGITWLFGFFYIYQNELFAYAFVVLNGLQGCFIFLFRCVLSEHYQTLFLKKIKCRFFDFKSKSSKKNGNVKTETKLYTVSATKSLSGETETIDSGYDTRLNKLEAKERLKLKSRAGIKSNTKRKSSSVDVNVNVIIKPEVSEAYLRNKMIAKNFSIRKSKAKWLSDSEDFSELSYHDIYCPN